ncbi:hypothetical protein TKK_0002924 [Trichogramma kaykai]
MGELGSATARNSVTAIKIKNLDEATSGYKICGALQTHLDGATGLGLEAVRSMRKAFEGIQTTVVTLTNQLAAKAIKLGRVQVGWVNCRIREKNEVRRWYAGVKSRGTWQLDARFRTAGRVAAGVVGRVTWLSIAKMCPPVFSIGLTLQGLLYNVTLSLDEKS